MLVSLPLLSFEDRNGQRTEVGCVYDDATRAISQVWAHHRGDTVPTVHIFVPGQRTALTLEQDVQRTTDVLAGGYTMIVVNEGRGRKSVACPLCLQVTFDRTVR